MSKRSWTWGAGRAGELRPVLLLLAAVVVPTIGVLWFVGVAIKNEQLAGRQRLTDAYRAHLDNLQRAVDTHWRELIGEIDLSAQRNRPGPLFKEVVQRGVDSLVCYDELGSVQYPDSLTGGASIRQPDTDRWIAARDLEFGQSDQRDRSLHAAAEEYAAIARESSEISERARAFLAQARCLYKASDDQVAVALVLNQLGKDEFASARDGSGRLVVPSAYLMAVEKLSTASYDDSLEGIILPGLEIGVPPELGELLRRLSQRLSSYDEPTLPASQRLFLMKELERLVPDRVDFATVDAEELAAKYVFEQPSPPPERVLSPSKLSGVWQLATPSGRAVVLLETQTIMQVAREISAAASLPADVAARIDPPGAPSPEEEFLSAGVSPLFPGWSLSLSLNPGRVQAAAADHSTLYLWTGILIVLSTGVTAILIAQVLQRQLRLARLKSDLVGTVSHELKTPLASIRLLVDTLLENDQRDPRQTSEYLQLIANENTRLTRLVDNFLTFSRMERGRIGFDFSQISPAQLVERSIEAAGDRFHQTDWQVSTQVAPDLPLIKADEDALVTVVLNLLDNAYKYSDDDRKIELRAFSRGGSVHLSVRDNGIGMSRAASKRVFQQFFQVDRTLSRRNQGCGLGLSIVDYIVRAHGGHSSVESRLGEGSTFTISLPAAVPEVVS